MSDCNPSHMENMPRLNRIGGQLDGVKKMIENGRYCPDIIIQLRAIRSALKAVESNILAKHLQHCVAQSFNQNDKDKKIEELKMLFDRFDD
ncbi:MAG: metal-sensitive transcriptional regulator [Alphaproteobacteria bacterium]|nr:metal-sensitive transcriptional regulator [Alphaproteobacteria bacterium]